MGYVSDVKIFNACRQCPQRSKFLTRGYAVRAVVRKTSGYIGYRVSIVDTANRRQRGRIFWCLWTVSTDTDFFEVW